MRTPDADTQSLQQPDSDKGWIVFGKMEKEPIIEPRRPGDPWFLMRRHRRKSKRVITDPATGVPLEDANAADMDEYDEYDEADALDDDSFYVHVGHLNGKRIVANLPFNEHRIARPHASMSGLPQGDIYVDTQTGDVYRRQPGRTFVHVGHMDSGVFRPKLAFDWRYLCPVPADVTGEGLTIDDSLFMDMRNGAVYRYTR